VGVPLCKRYGILASRQSIIFYDDLLLVGRRAAVALHLLRFTC